MSVRSALRAAATFAVRSLPSIGGGLVVGVLLSAPVSLEAQQLVTNTAAATYQTLVGGMDSVASNPVQTTVVRPMASLQKTVVGSRSVGVGEVVQYRILYENTSLTFPITGALLVDSLPTGLDYVSAQPAATVSGRVLQWALGDLPPGSNAQIDLTLMAASGVQDTLLVQNSVSLSSVNANSALSLAEVVALIGPPSRQLSLDHTAELLEVGLGETAPFTLVLRNTGSLQLTDLVVHVVLPDGGRYAPGSAIGADSANVAGQSVAFYLAGPLAPGASATVHYSMAVVSASTPTLTSMAYATADGAQVRSVDAAAFLKVRLGFAMEDRAVIGKVWVDLNGNGVQDDGEPGVQGAEVWSDDGEISTTDADGRFSYRNLRPGHHGFRLDPSTLPTAYQLAESGAGAGLVTRDASGWTTPRVDFRLLDRGGRLSAVRLPVGWSAGAYPETVASSPVPSVPALPGAVPPVPSGVDSLSAAAGPLAAAGDSLPGADPLPGADSLPGADPSPGIGARPDPVESPPAAAAPSPEMVPVPPAPDFTLPPMDPSDATFAFASSDLKPASLAILRRIADSLRVHEAVRVEIGGHTDSTGPHEYNVRLSLARAQAVQRTLVQRGIDASRLVVQGYGPDRPVTSNATREGRARNRRWEINVLAQATPEPPGPQDAELEATPTGPPDGEPENTTPGPRDAEREPLGSANFAAAYAPKASAESSVGISGGISAEFTPTFAPHAGAAQAPVRYRVRYEAGIRNPYGATLEGLTVRFPAAVDSVVLRSGDSILAWGSGSAMILPPIAADAEVRVLGWGEGQGEGAGVSLERDGRVLDVASIPRGDSGGVVERTLTLEFRADTLPDPATVEPGSEIEITIDPPPGGWLGTATFPLPPGWEVIPDPGAGTSPPSIDRDRSGSSVLLWQLGAPRQAPIVLRLRPAGSGVGVEPVRVEIARPPESREAEKRRAFLDGPAVTIFEPGDGQVLARDRVFVGVRGEPGASVTLFDGDSLIEKTSLRADGVHDFIAVPLAPGPHRLRVRMPNSSSNERWDSIAVHVTGAPATFVAERPQITLVADGNTVETVRIRVLDAWGVPVTNRPEITVGASGAEPVNPDENPSSVGVQMTPDEAGWLDVRLRSGHTVMRGTLDLSWAELSQELAFDVLPAIQPLLVAGVGRVGVGASPGAFGALTARGRLDPRTSLVVSYDSRRLDAGRAAFGRTADPLEQSQYPILGDASAQRSTSASRYQLAARVERGFDWVALGDVSTAGFGSELQLSGYRRALPGMAARITTGGIVWQVFGSSTSQLLQQLQVRGAGSSGPYQLNRNVREGTEQVVLEIRAAENAARVVSRQVLVRYVDYQIDYEAGSLLFKQPVPAADAYGNSVFIQVLYEAESGGPRGEVWGIRSSVDGNRWLRMPLMDSLRMGATWVHESRDAGGHQLLGADMRLLRTGALELSGETSWSQSMDSSGVAATLKGAVTTMGGAARLSAAWLVAGRGFSNPANVALQGGTEEIRIGGELKQGGRVIQLGHEWQRFGALGLERRQTTASALQPLGSNVEVKATMADDLFRGTATDGSRGGELRVQWKPAERWTLFTDARRQFSSVGAQLKPDYVGVGAVLDVTEHVALDLRHRQVLLPGDSSGYSVTDFGVRTQLGRDTEAYGQYQIAGVEGGRNAALVGLRNQLRLGSAWALNAQFERRSGLGRASLFDPVRALPFLQAEEDYWSAGLGAEFLEAGAPYRLSARGEYREGDLRSTRLVTVAGDVSLNRSFAVLSRQELLGVEQNTSGVLTRGHRYSSLWGLAFRPVHSDALNVLGKAEWIDADNGNGGGVLLGPMAEGRTILAGEAIWQPRRGSEVAARYAFRRASGSLIAADGAALQLRSIADFVGARASFQLRPLLELRADGRLLNERTTGASRWDLAPALAVVPLQALEVLMGYRLGDLRDPDFAVHGGPGWFLTFGARVTEGTFGSAAEFWRQRLGGR